MIVMRWCGQKSNWFSIFLLFVLPFPFKHFNEKLLYEHMHIWRHQIPYRAPPWKLEKGLKRGEGWPPLAAACLCLISIKCHRHRWDQQNPGWFDDDEWTRAYHKKTLMLKSEVFLFYRVVFLTGPPLKMSLDWPPQICLDWPPPNLFLVLES